VLIAQRVAPCDAGDLRIGARRCLLAALVEVALVNKPRERVTTAIAARQPPDGARRKKDQATGKEEILRDLHARLPTADDKHRARRQLAGTPILGSVQLQDRARQRRGHRGNPRHAGPATCDDHRTGLDKTVIVKDG
jgi:hypothetical protein